MPVRWSELWQSLPGRQRRGSDWEPPPPLVVGEWFTTPSFAKMERLAEHIRWADAHGALAEADTFLRGLTESEWAHVREFLTRPTESRRPARRGCPSRPGSRRSDAAVRVRSSHFARQARMRRRASWMLSRLLA